MNSFHPWTTAVITLVIAVLNILPFGSLITHASEGFAEYVQIEDTDVTAGDIIVLIGNDYRKSSQPYSPNMVGVVTNEPAVAFGVAGKENTNPVVTASTVLVSVTAQNGNIKEGDLITSSSIPGIGMLATEPGNVLGIAREAFEPDNPDTQGQIAMTINIHFASVNNDDPNIKRSVAEYVRRSLIAGAVAAATEPNTALRYAAASLVGIISLLFGFISSARSANNGIAAIGRNPIARKTILLGIFINIFITVIIAAAGLSLAAFLLAW